MQTAEQFIKQAPVSVIMNHMIVKPSVYHGKTSCIIVATNKFEEDATPGIYEYNLESEQINMVHEYDFRDLPMTPGFEYYHTQMLNPAKDTLYVMGQNYFAQPMSFNLKTKEAIYDIKLPFCQWDIIPTTVYIPSPIDECHVFDVKCNHFKFDTENNKAMVVKMQSNMSSLQPEVHLRSRPFYLPSEKQLMIMGFSHYDEILVCDVLDSNQQNYEWKSYPLKMPHLVTNLDYYDILVVQHLVFVFYFPKGGYSDIWCLDLSRKKWFQSPHKISERFDNLGNTFAFKDRFSDVHIIDFYTGCHDKISLHHLIPNQLQQIYSKQIELLINGEIRQNEKNKKIPIIPRILKDMICKYYPLFW